MALSPPLRTVSNILSHLNPVYSGWIPACRTEPQMVEACFNWRAEFMEPQEPGPAREEQSSLPSEFERTKAELRLRMVRKIAALERFAAGIVHDFNNVLTVIVGHSQVLLEQAEVGASARLRVQQILEAALRAAGLSS